MNEIMKIQSSERLLLSKLDNGIMHAATVQRARQKTTGNGDKGCDKPDERKSEPQLESAEEAANRLRTIITTTRFGNRTSQ
jgi:hypothetical protein